MSSRFVCEFLSHPEWWFANSAEIDDDLWNRFGGPEFVDHFSAEKISIDDVIYGDQLGRHAERFGKITFDQRCTIDRICCVAAYNLLGSMETMSMTKIFIMLCIRHSKNINLIKTHILSQLPRDAPDRQILDGWFFKFWRTTIEVCADLIEPEYDQCPRDIDFGNAANHLSIESPHSKINTSVCDNRIIGHNLSDTNICNYQIIGRDLSELHYQELPDIVRYNSSTPKFRSLVNSIKNLIGTRKVILSYSGGIDSSLLIACGLLLKGQLVAAVMINYENRETSTNEEEVCRRIAKLYGIPLVIRRISEVRRSRHSDDRVWYEEITRKIRFKAYEFAMKRYGAEAIILGHNADDVEENIISNIRKGIHLENLKGMLPESSENAILRPWLNVSKLEIIGHVKNLRLAHLWNSTPTWSERGRIRNELIPALDNFEQSFMPGLVKIANDYSTINRWFIDQIKSSGKTIQIVDSSDIKHLVFPEIDISRYPNLSIIWRTIVNLAVEHTREHVSNKAIECIVARESSQKYNPCRNYTLTPNVKMIINENTIHFHIADRR